MIIRDTKMKEQRERKTIVDLMKETEAKVKVEKMNVIRAKRKKEKRGYWDWGLRSRRKKGWEGRVFWQEKGKEYTVI